MAIQLTQNAIAFLSNLPDKHSPDDFKPVLQVTEIKLVKAATPPSGPSPGGPERYRVLLSDGVSLQQGMLATQRNDFVHQGRLKKGTVVRLTEFVISYVKDRLIIIIIDLDVLLETCDIIGEPKACASRAAGGNPQSARSSSPAESSLNQQVTGAGRPQPYVGSTMAASVPRPNVSVGNPLHPPEQELNGAPHLYGSVIANNPDSGRYNPAHTPSLYPKAQPGGGVSRTPNNYIRPVHPGYNQPRPLYTNMGPVAKNEAPPMIVPIGALNLYLYKWTIKARVTSKSELRLYNNARGDGKVFSFDLLDAQGGEIRVTCFNTVADQFFPRVEAGKVYLISRGSLKHAQKNFNHLPNDLEIFLDNTSTVDPCFEDDPSIPKQNFNFRPISDIEVMDTNSILDIIGVVSFIAPTKSFMRKDGTESQKRLLHLKDMSGRSVEFTLWGNFCNAEGQRLQNMCDSGVHPVLAVKSGRVSDYNGKAVGTISSSQLFIEPDFPKARQLRAWYDVEGKNTPSVSISRESTNIGRTDVRKTILQIKDEKLGTSEKPDWITVSASISFIKTENFSYPACPKMIGDRQCSKKVVNNGDGKWSCERCNDSVDQCDYRYILQLQIQDHTGSTWATAFQEAGEQIMGISAKDLYIMKPKEHQEHEEEDEVMFAETIRNVLFNKYLFKLKVKEETFSDEQRVKSSVVKAEKLNSSSATKFLLDLVENINKEDPSSMTPQVEMSVSTSELNNNRIGSVEFREPPPVANYAVSGQPANHGGPYGNQYTSSRNATPTSGSYMGCSNCGDRNHMPANCPSSASAQGHSYGGSLNSRVPSGGSGSGQCFKCHQSGHWAKDCPVVSNVPPAYGVSRQHVGGF